MTAFLAEWAIRSSILVILATLLLAVLRARNAAARLAAWVAVLLASLAIPALTLLLPSIPFTVSTPVSNPQAAVPAHPIATPAIGAIEIQTHAATPLARSIDWPAIVQIAYLLIASALLLRLLGAILLSLRLKRSSRATAIDGVRESAAITAPVTLGALRPAIVLPADWRDWDPSKLEAVLAHERSHIDRLDPAIQLLASLHQALLWFSPLSWFLNRKIVRTAEEASDDAAMAATRDRAAYAEVLLDFMRRGVRGNLAAVGMARYGSPSDRIDRVLNSTEFSRGISRTKMLAILAVGVIAAALVASAQPQRPPLPPAPPPAFVPLPPIPAASVDQAPPPAPAPRTPEGLPLLPAPPMVAAPASLPEPPSAAMPPAPPSAATLPNLGFAHRAGRKLFAMALAPDPPAEPQSSSSSDSIRSYMISYGDDSMTMGSWSSRESPRPEDMRSRFGNHFAWFRRGDHEYVITDAGVMAEIERAMEPQQDVNRRQSDVNQEQSKVNDLQHDVNLKQDEVNALQKTVNQVQEMVNRLQSAVNNGVSDDVLRRLEEALKQLRESKQTASQNDVNRAQNRVNDAQNKVNAEQSKVNQLQSKVNDAQRAASGRIRDQLRDIFESAIDRNLARQIK